MMRFGVMCSGTVFQQWQANAIMELKKHGHQPVLLITDCREVLPRGLIRRFINKNLHTLLFSVLENRFFSPSAKRLVSMESELAGVDVLPCRVDQKGYSEHFRESDISIIRSCRLDFILRFGFNIIRGDILETAKFGVWSFHHDDEMKYRGGPAGFWEIYHDDPVNGAILQRLTSKLDGGIILRKGYLKTLSHSWTGNLQQLLTVTSMWPALAADELSGLPDDEDSATMKISSTNARIFKVPGNLQMILFLWKLFRNRISFYFHEFIKAEQWNVGIVAKPIHEIAQGDDFLKSGEITWMATPEKHTYYADPFGFVIENNLYVFLEVFSYKEMKGRISDFIFYINPDRKLPPHQGSWNPSGRRNPIRVGEETGHLSYPFILEFQGERYCVPESNAAGKICLYRFDFQKLIFSEEKVLIANVDAVDPTLVFYRDLWWLFFTDRLFSNTHLNLYYSDRLNGDYKPHCLNPVKIDIRSARPGGTPFIHEGNLYRPSQDCSKTYGGRVIVNKVLHITPEIFEEEIVRAVEPAQNSHYHHGLHTLSGVGDLTLIDGKTYRANWFYFVNQCRKKFLAKTKQRV
ncbi:MAG: hypothetical protein NT004_12790 [Bacteroidetes bacterium]|nr:hypothetical protein [Bacteroidota bacterium]